MLEITKVKTSKIIEDYHKKIEKEILLLDSKTKKEIIR